MRRTLAPVVLTVVTLLIAGTAAAETAEERFEQSFAFAAGDTLTLANTNGDIVIESWDRDEAQVRAFKRVKARRGDAEEALSELRIDVDSGPGGLEVETYYPNWKRMFGWSDVSASVDYRISLPARASLDVHTVNGEIQVSAISGDIRLRSTNGDVVVGESSGRVDARTTNGGIEVELHQVEALSDMEFQTTNGGIRLYLPSEIAASIEARTTNGTIDTDFPIQVQGTFRRNRLEGNINGGGGRIELRTTNGSIRIRER